MEGSLTEGEKFKAKRLGEKKIIKNYERTAVRKDDRELQSLRNERWQRREQVDRCNEESVGVI